MNERLAVQNLKCSGCTNSILKTLNGISGLENIAVDVNSGMISYQYSELLQSDLAKQHLKSIGYPLVNEENGLATIAKSFVSCSIGRISKKTVTSK